MWPFTTRSRDPWSLRAPLLYFSKRDPFTIGDAFEGTLIVGATGSGKSTGSGQSFALAMLRAGFGGLVLTAKPDERAVWERYCRATGRFDDLRVFSPGGPYRYNFLDHELHRGGNGAGLTDNIVHLFAQVLQIAERGSGGGGGREDEGYWRRACFQLIRNSVDLLIMAKDRLTVADLYRIVVTAPTSFATLDSEKWLRSSFCYHCLQEADRRPKTPIQHHDYDLVGDYFLKEFPGLSERTRSVICSTFTSMIDTLHRGVLSELFCTDTSLTPEAIEDGAIVLIDLPVKEFGAVGQFSQVLWKTSFQRSIERRDVVQNPRPVFLWADEAQYFVTSPFDMQFQTTCRASRVATVLLTQNISNVYAALGGSDTGKAEADSLFGNLNAKVFHANTDPVTNEWAALQVGRTRQWLTNATSHYAPADTPFSLFGQHPEPSMAAGITETIDFELPPNRFVTLRRGGPANRWLVDAIVLQGGRRFHKTGKTWMPVTFRQR